MSSIVQNASVELASCRHHEKIPNTSTKLDDSVNFKCVYRVNEKAYEVTSATMHLYA
jgi:hypothetical protein